MGEIKEKLIEYTKTDEYKNSLSTNIEKKLEELNESSDNFEILVRKEDMNLISYPHLGHLDEKYIGGFILKSIDGSYQYNYTYLKKIEEEKYDIGRTLYNLFEKESFNESNN